MKFLDKKEKKFIDAEQWFPWRSMPEVRRDSDGNAYVIRGDTLLSVNPGDFIYHEPVTNLVAVSDFKVFLERCELAMAQAERFR